MKFKILAGFALLAVVICVNSCENNLTPPAGLSPGCDTTNLTYTNQMQLLINTNCGTLNTGCHAPGVGRRGDFTSYASLYSYVTGGQRSLFWRYIFIQQKMPLFPELPLDACTSAKFKAWLSDGAPQ